MKFLFCLFVIMNTLPKHHVKKPANNETYTLTVKVVNASNDEGQMAFAVFDNKEDFLENPLSGEFAVIKNNRSTYTFEGLSAGTYAVSVYHDENKNGKLDRNFVGAPSEDYNTSNDARNTFSAPKWKDAKFKLTGDMEITIKL